MDMKLRAALMAVQEQHREEIRKLQKAGRAGEKLTRLGRRIYKQAITAQPELAGVPLWDQFREALDIPLGAVEPTEVEPDKELQASIAAVNAVSAVGKVAEFTDLDAAGRAELLEQLDAAVADARSRLTP